MTDGIAFLGCGAIAAEHARTLARVAPDLPRFYASRDVSRARSYASRFGGAGAFGSYESAIRDPRVAAVVVTTPPVHHREPVLAAIDAGKTVIVEKPAFPTSADAREVLERATAAGVEVLVAENYAHKPLVRALRRLIASGELGDVRFVFVNAVKQQTTADWRADPAVAGGGALLEGGIHWVSFMAQLGLDVESAHGAVHPRGHGEGDRSALVAVRYRGGAAGALLHSWEVPSPLRGARLSRIYGTRGSAVFESNGAFVASWSRRPRVVVPDLRDPAGSRSMWREFVRILRRGGNPTYSLSGACRDLALVEQVASSD